MILPLRSISNSLFAGACPPGWFSSYSWLFSASLLPLPKAHGAGESLWNCLWLILFLEVLRYCDDWRALMANVSTVSLVSTYNFNNDNIFQCIQVLYHNWRSGLRGFFRYNSCVFSLLLSINAASLIALILISDSLTPTPFSFWPCHCTKYPVFLYAWL